MVITVASAMIPILRLTKIPLKNIILLDLKARRTKPTKWWILGAVSMVTCAVVPGFLPHNLIGMIAACALATFAIAGLVPLIPFLTRQISKASTKIPGLSQEVQLGIRNVRDSKSLMNSIQLFASAIAIVAFMASLFNTMGTDLVRVWDRDVKYDLSLVLRHTDKASLEALGKINGVKSYAGCYQYYYYLSEHQTYLNTLYGIENEDIFQYMPVGQVQENKKALDDLNTGKNIIVANVLKDSLGLHLGDKLSIQFSDHTSPYAITGFIETNWGIGHVGYISAANYRAETGATNFDYVYVKTDGDPDTVKKSIFRALGKEVLRLDTKEELRKANADKVVGIFKAINTYAQLALLVGLIGIINNLAASFLERKRSFALLRCVGMSRKGLNRMLLTEAAVMGLSGVVFGILTAVVMSRTIPSIVLPMWGKVSVHLAVNEIVVLGIGGFLALVVLSIIPVLGNRKISLM